MALRGTKGDEDTTQASNGINILRRVLNGARTQGARTRTLRFGNLGL